MRVLACANQKGGVGKTTCSLNICYSLANTYNQRVLLIDMDSQASSSLNLGLDVADEGVHTIDELLDPLIRNRKISWDLIEECIYTPTYTDRQRDPENGMKWVTIERPFGFDIIPSELYLSVIEMLMGIAGGATKTGINMHYLEMITDRIEEQGIYDWIIIDTPPSLGPLSICSVAAARDGIIIVSNLDVMSTRGITSFIESANTVKNFNKNHRGILGILLSLYSDRRTIDRSIDKWVQEFLPIPTFDTRIPDTADVKKANSSALLVSQINKKARAAFDSLCAEIMYAVEHPEEPIGSARKAAMGEL